MFVEMLPERIDKVSIFNDLPIEEQIKIINQFYKDTKNNNKVYKKGSFYIITDVESCEAFGLAQYDEDGRYIKVYSLKEVKQFVFDFVKNLDRDNLRVLVKIVPDLSEE